MNDNIQVLCEQAQSLVQEKNFEQATTVCDKILKNDPKSNFALFNKAFSLQQLEKLEDALKSYELLIQFHSESQDPSAAFYNKGLVHRDLADFAQAEYCFRTVISFHPEDPDSWYMRGDAFDSLDEKILAEACYSHANKLNENHSSNEQKTKDESNNIYEKGKKSINTPFGQIKNEPEPKIDYLDEVSRTEDSRIKQALASLHSRLSENDRENAYKWSAYYRGLVDGGSEV